MPYLLDTRKQDGDLWLILMRKLTGGLSRTDNHKHKHEKKITFCSASTCTYAWVVRALITAWLCLSLWQGRSKYRSVFMFVLMLTL